MLSVTGGQACLEPPDANSSSPDSAPLRRWGFSAQTKRQATDWVTLGKSGVKVTRLAFGTGTHGGRVHGELGQDAFTHLVRHAYDSGIRFFETADTYTGMHEMLGIALKGLPLRQLPSDGRNTRHRMRAILCPSSTCTARQLNTEYFDIMLLHCVRPATWITDYVDMQERLRRGQHRKMILSHGASVHGLPALRKFPGTSSWRSR